MQIPSGSEPNLEALEEILRENGVIYGIKEETLKTLSQSHLENIEVVVASGNWQVDGRDGRVVFDFPLTYFYGEWEGANIKVANRIHAFTSIGFGKYIFRIDNDYFDVHAVLEVGEIMVRPNESSDRQNE